MHRAATDSFPISAPAILFPLRIVMKFLPKTLPHGVMELSNLGKSALSFQLKSTLIEKKRTISEFRERISHNGTSCVLALSIALFNSSTSHLITSFSLEPGCTLGRQLLGISRHASNPIMQF
ncbi:hypothetical protein NPIL_234351, partial [Nephila pilipes]